MRRKPLIIICVILVIITVSSLTIMNINAASNWQPNTSYKTGDFVLYDSITYKCIQSHTSLTGWEPPNVPALWEKTSSSDSPETTSTKIPDVSPTITPSKTDDSTDKPSEKPLPSEQPVIDGKLIVGYWHNFDNGSTTMRLKDVSEKWDVINVAFADSVDGSTITFTPFNSTKEEFKSDIKYLNSKGKKVVLSIGGQNCAITLNDASAKDKFVSSMTKTIEEYGFNGMDIDVETGIALGNGDTDYKNPTTPAIVNMISATKEICNHFRNDFELSMAPEIAYVQGGITAYGGPWGAYLPIINGLRDELTYIHVQHYNCGGNTALDGKTYNHGTADFEVAMADMLISGFPIANNSDNIFKPLREDQVVIGLPACRSAAPSGGYINPTEMKKALDYLIKGVSFGGDYKLKNSDGYKNFRGLMTWSINWDKANNNEFLNSYSSYFDSIGE